MHLRLRRAQVLTGGVEGPLGRLARDPPPRRRAHPDRAAPASATASPCAFVRAPIGPGSAGAFVDLERRVRGPATPSARAERAVAYGVPAAAASRRSIAVRARSIGSRAARDDELRVGEEQRRLDLERELRRRPPPGRSRPRPGRRGPPSRAAPSQSPRKRDEAVADRARAACRPRRAPRRRSSRRGRCRPRRSAGSRRRAGAGARARSARPRRARSPARRRRASPCRPSRAGAPPWSRSGRTGRSCSSPPRRPAGRSRARRCPRPWRAAPPRRGSPSGSARRRSAGAALPAPARRVPVAVTLMLDNLARTFVSFAAQHERSCCNWRTPRLTPGI